MVKYIYLAVILVGINFFQSFFLPSGGVYADSLSYFGIAADLPHPVTNLFPMGYPAVLRIFFEIFRDYFWAAKILNTAMLATILIFSYFRRFYFRETVLLAAGKTFLFVFSIAISESLFIFLFYFLIYNMYQMLMYEGFRLRAVIAASGLMILMFATRYSGIYIYIATGIFYLLMMIRNERKHQLKNFFLFLGLSGFGIGAYLFLNYIHFGSFTGENLRGAPAEILPLYIFRDLVGVANTVNPYIGLKPASSSFASLTFQGVLFVVDMFVLIYMLRYFRKAGESGLTIFHSLLWTVAVVYACALLFSGWFQQIEEMNIRMMAAANVCLFFSFLIIYFETGRADKWVFRIGCLFLAFNVLYSLKSPVNYFEKRNQIEPQMLKFKHKRYMFIDDKNLETATSYHIPIIDKDFKYSHTNDQKGEIKQNIAGTINPKIKWLKYDTIQDKSQVLYTSELKLK